MFGVLPIIPLLYAPMFHVPMSSPNMTRMFGFWPPVWASAPPIEVTGLGARADAAARVVPASRILRLLIPWLQHDSCVDFAFMRLLLRRQPLKRARLSTDPVPGRFLADCVRSNAAAFRDQRIVRQRS